MKDIVNYINENTTDGKTVMDLGIKYLFSILKRLVACKVKHCIMCNGVFMSAYDTDDDNDETGFNHFIISMDSGSFYSGMKYINVDSLYNKMKDDDKHIEDFRKELKIKPSDKSTVVKFNDSVLDVSYLFMGEPVNIYEYKLSPPPKKVEKLVTSMINKMNNMFCGDYVYISESYDDIMAELENCPRTLMREVQVGDRTVQYPFMKSTLFRLTKPDFMKSRIGDVNLAKINGSSEEGDILGEVYSYSIFLAKNKILEIHSAYMVNYI